MLKKSELFFFRNEEREGAGKEGKAFIRARSTSCLYVCMCACVCVCMCVCVYRCMCEEAVQVRPLSEKE